MISKKPYIILSMFYKILHKYVVSAVQHVFGDFLVDQMFNDLGYGI